MGNKQSSPPSPPPPPLTFETVPTPKDVEIAREKDIAAFATFAEAARIDLLIINDIFKDTTNPKPFPKSVYIYIESDIMKHAAYEFIDRHVVDKLRSAGWNVTSKKDDIHLTRECLRWRRNMTITKEMISGGCGLYHVTVLGIASKPVKKKSGQPLREYIYKQSECIICLDSAVDAQYVIIPCGHANYCTACAKGLASITGPASCPICRAFPINVCKIIH